MAPLIEEYDRHMEDMTQQLHRHQVIWSMHLYTHSGNLADAFIQSDLQ